VVEGADTCQSNPAVIAETGPALERLYSAVKIPVEVSRTGCKRRKRCAIWRNDGYWGGGLAGLQTRSMFYLLLWF
jgi:hypothetical protein